MAKPIARWTTERINRLVALWKDGKSASEIAMDLNAGFTRSAILGKVHRLRISKDGGALPHRAPRNPTPTKLRKPKALREWARPKQKPRPPLHQPDPMWPMTAPAGTALLDLKASSCRYPIGGQAAGTIFCGKNKSKNRPYCEHHCAAAYRGVKWRAA